MLCWFWNLRPPQKYMCHIFLLFVDARFESWMNVLVLTFPQNTENKQEGMEGISRERVGNTGAIKWGKLSNRPVKFIQGEN